MLASIPSRAREREGEKEKERRKEIRQYNHRMRENICKSYI
jgi:hypothetical protein